MSKDGIRTRFKHISRRDRFALAIGIVVVILLVGIVTGYWLGHRSGEAAPGKGTEAAAEGQAKKTQFWTCAMHPQIRQPEPGNCPICGMELIPVSSESGSEMAGLREFRASEDAKQLMHIETSPVERKFVTKDVRLVGKIDYDETRLSYITAWIPGRFDRLYVDFTGIDVRKGDHMVSLYSPELLTAQEELRRTLEALKNMRPGAPEVLRETAKATLEAARAKLRRWGLTDEQIADAEKNGVSSDHATIYAPISGTVIVRNGQEGMYVQEGTRIYTLADLSSVWVKLDAYESDLPWLHYGQRVSFTTEAYPGEEFDGRISFIEPVLDATTRTVKVRVNVANPDGRLKPEMFVRSEVRAQVATGGRVMDPSLAGKWICPMHPEVIEDKPGTCEICGMQLVKAKDLGYVSAQPNDEDMPLVIPASAALVTGTRAIVYVEKPDTEVPTYDGRQIVLGPRAGDYYLVRAGLEEGERVVTRGNFKIDSALQILAKPSMMTPEGGGGGGMHMAGMGSEAKGESTVAMRIDPRTVEQITALEAAETVLSEAVAADDHSAIPDAIEGVKRALNEVDMSLLAGHEHLVWMEYSMRLHNDLVEMEGTNTHDDLANLVKTMAHNLSQLRDKLGIHAPVKEPFNAPKFAVPDAFKKQLGAVSDAYLGITSALANDDEKAAHTAVEETLQALGAVSAKNLEGKAADAWVEQSTELDQWLKAMRDAKDIDGIRSTLDALTDSLADTLELFDETPEPPIYEVHCPMAMEGEGGNWLQRGAEVHNPYFGHIMPTCGTVLRKVGVHDTDDGATPTPAPGDRIQAAPMTDTDAHAGAMSHE